MSLPGGVGISRPVGMSRGGMCKRLSVSWGGYVQGVPTPLDMGSQGYNGIRSSSGQYASYWNAFLLLEPRSSL